MKRTLEQRVAELERMVAELDTRTSGLRGIGPLPRQEPEPDGTLERIIRRMLREQKRTAG